MNRVWSFLRNILGEKTVSEEIKNDTPRRIPFFRLIIEPYGMVIDSLRVFTSIALVIAFAMSLAAFVFNHPYLCFFPDYQQNHVCGENVFTYGIMQIILLFLICCFFVRWAQIITGKEKLNMRFIVRLQKTDIKVYGVLILLLLLNLVSVLCGWLLYEREPNPNYQIELIYFTVVGSGVLSPLLAMRFYSLFGFAVLKEQFPPLSVVWKRGRGNSLRILISFGLIFFTTTFILISFFSEVRKIGDKNGFFVRFGVEYFYSLLILLAAAFFINHCLLQKKYLFEREDDGNKNR